jgi:hypothetical protein
MTFSTGSRLDIGSRFPRLTLQLLDGSSLTLPDDWAGHAGAVLFYRGHW